MSLTNYSRYKYTPDEIDEEEFLSKFVVRNHEFEEIFDDLKTADYNVPNQHYIIIGQRGQGKTTLLRKIKLAIQNSPKLSAFLLPIKFTEEQYQIRSLCRLWEEVADYLQSLYENEFEDILDKMESHFDDDDYELKCFSYLESYIKSKNKKLILLIDNIDELLGKLKPKEQQRLREILLSSSTFRIIGGSTKMIEQQYDYSQPFYQFFNIVKLQGLNKEESILFLQAIGNQQQTNKIQQIIKDEPQRIETLRRLTGGVPRTLVMLFDIFLDNSDNAFDDLLKILDDATPLYKHRMDDLPDMLQDITHTIAMNWDGMLTKDIAKKTRLSSKIVSSQLNQLEKKYGIVESTSIGKNKIYKLEERFFNIWYLMRFGRKKDRQNIEWLVKFLVSWCSPKELEDRASRFMTAVKAGKVNDSHAYLMCEILSYTGLKLETEHQMKSSVKEYLTQNKSKFAADVSDSDADVIQKAHTLEKENRLDDAVKLLEKSQKSSPPILNVLGYLYEEQKNDAKAESFYLKAVDAGDTDALFHLGHLYENQKNDDKAESYYLKAVDAGNTEALFSLGYLYDNQKDNAKAENYYLKAVDAGITEAENNLGVLYAYQQNDVKAKNCFLKAVDGGNTEAGNNLGLLYAKQQNDAKAESTFLKAIDGGNTDARINLGVLYTNQNKHTQAENTFLKAFNAGDTNALSNLSWVHFKQAKLLNKAVKLIKVRQEHSSNSQSIYVSAAVFLWAEEFTESNTMFIKWLQFEGAVDYENDITLYLSLLMAKGQFFNAKALFELPDYDFKNRYKPLWYALMHLMQDELPNEIKKMGSELKESVDEILKEIETLRIKYALK